LDAQAGDSQMVKGQSGNPAGWPPGSRNKGHHSGRDRARRLFFSCN
jgi:hypothetical protein